MATNIKQQAQETQLTIGVQGAKTSTFTLLEKVSGIGKFGAGAKTGGSGTAQPQPTPTPTPETVTVSSSDLQLIMSAIPIAQDGHVISAEYHNSVRLAVLALANRLGITAGSDSGINVISAPRLQPKTGTGIGEWESDVGFVKKSAATGGASVPASIQGWMEMELPHGARILSLGVFGTRTGNGTLTARLHRQQITDPTVSQILSVRDVPAGNDASKPIEADVTLPGMGAGPSTIAEYRVIDNDKHKYLVTVELAGADAAATAQINAIKISCGF